MQPEKENHVPFCRPLPSDKGSSQTQESPADTNSVPVITDRERQIAQILLERHTLVQVYESEIEKIHQTLPTLSPLDSRIQILLNAIQIAEIDASQKIALLFPEIATAPEATQQAEPDKVPTRRVIQYQQLKRHIIQNANSIADIIANTQLEIGRSRDENQIEGIRADGYQKIAEQAGYTLT